MCKKSTMHKTVQYSTHACVLEMTNSALRERKCIFLLPQSKETTNGSVEALLLIKSYESIVISRSSNLQNILCNPYFSKKD